MRRRCVILERTRRGRKREGERETETEKEEREKEEEEEVPLDSRAFSTLFFRSER